MRGRRLWRGKHQDRTETRTEQQRVGNHGAGLVARFSFGSSPVGLRLWVATAIGTLLSLLVTSAGLAVTQTADPPAAAPASADPGALQDLKRRCEELLARILPEEIVLERDRDGLEEEWELLLRERERVDLKDAAAVDRWNQKKDAVVDRRRAFNERVRQLNAQVRAYNRLVVELRGLGGAPGPVVIPPSSPPANANSPANPKPGPGSAALAVRAGLSLPAGAPDAEPLKTAPIAGGDLMLAYSSFWRLVDAGNDSIRFSSEPAGWVAQVEWRDPIPGETAEQRARLRVERYRERYERVERLPDRKLADETATLVVYVIRTAEGARETLILERQDAQAIVRVTVTAAPEAWTRDGGQVVRLLAGLRRKAE